MDLMLWVIFLGHNNFEIAFPFYFSSEDYILDKILCFIFIDEFLVVFSEDKCIEWKFLKKIHCFHVYTCMLTTLILNSALDGNLDESLFAFLFFYL